MALPGITSVTIVDGSLGIAPDNTTGIHVKLGQCSQGVTNQLYTFSSVQDVKQTLGTGKLVKAMSTALDIAGGPIYALRLNTSIAGSVSDIQEILVTTGTPSDGVLSLAGSSPLDDYQFIVKIKRAGKIGVSPYPTFIYSLDDGLTYSDEIVIPVGGVYTVPQTGVILTFTNGSNGFMATDTFIFTTTAPTWNNTDVSNGMIALLADSRTWGFIHLVGVADTTIGSTMAAFMTSAQTNERYVHSILEARDMDMIARLKTTGMTFPLTLGTAGSNLLKIDVSYDGGLTFPDSVSYTFASPGTFANIAALVSFLRTNLPAFSGGFFSVGNEANNLVLSTISIKGQVVLKVNPASTAIGGAGLLTFTSGQTAGGEKEDTWINDLITSWTPFVSDRIAVFAGTADIFSSADGQYNIRNGAWIMSGREALVPISEDLGKVARGPLPFILTPDLAHNKYGIYHDEDAKPSLDVARFCTLRRFKGLPGFYITNGRTFATPGSDFTYIQYRRVIDRAATLLGIVAKQYINTEVRVNADGTIYEIDARSIEDRVSSFLYSQLKDNLTALSIKVDRTINILSSQNLKITCSIRPFGYAKFISLVIGFAPTVTQ